MYDTGYGPYFLPSVFSGHKRIQVNRNAFWELVVVLYLHCVLCIYAPDLEVRTVLRIA